MFGITIRATGSTLFYREMVEQASRLESEPSISRLGYAPHITLTRYEGVAPPSLTDALNAFEQEDMFTLTFDRVAMFDSDQIVLWLSPKPDRRLARLQAKVFAALDGEQCDPHYRPERWQPHLTIAASVSSEHRQQAMEFTARRFEPVSLAFDAADCVSWPPVTVLATRNLEIPTAA